MLITLLASLVMNNSLLYSQLAYEHAEKSREHFKRRNRSNQVTFQQEGFFFFKRSMAKQLSS